MKHLESYNKSGWMPYIRPKFKIGDYVRVDTIIKRIKDSIYIIRERYRQDGINNYRLENINVQKQHWEDESNLIPLSKEEVKLIKDTDKYNL